MPQLIIKGNRKSIIKKCKNPEILVYTDDIDCTQKSIDITGDRIIKYRYKIDIDGKVIKDFGNYILDDISENIVIPDLAFGKHKLNISVEQDDGQIISKSIDINVLFKTNFSRVFNGTTDYISVTMPNDFILTDRIIQVVVKTNGGSFSCIEDKTNTYVKINGSNMKIAKGQNCIIEEVRIWDSTKVKPYENKPLYGNEDGLVAYYRMNEMEGDMCFDSSSNQYHGQYTGTKVSEDTYMTKDLMDAIIQLDKDEVIAPQNTDYDFKYKIVKPELPVGEIKLSDNVVNLDGGKVYTLSVKDIDDWLKIDGIGII